MRFLDILIIGGIAIVYLNGCGSPSAPAKSGSTGDTDTASVAESREASVTELSVDEAELSQSQFVDVNRDQLRQQYGVVPGAILVSYSDVSNLPDAKETALVFYCATERCGASHHAASLALADGYTEVSVMPAGIKGWVKAGKATDKL